MLYGWIVKQTSVVIIVTKIWDRHQILSQTIGTKEKENMCFNNVSALIIIVSILFSLLSILELAVYFFYNFKVSVYLSILVNTKE